MITQRALLLERLQYEVKRWAEAHEAYIFAIDYNLPRLDKQLRLQNLKCCKEKAQHTIDQLDRVPVSNLPF